MLDKIVDDSVTQLTAHKQWKEQIETTGSVVPASFGVMKQY